MEMLVLPGGGLGTKNLNESPAVDRWLHYAAEKGIWIAAICAAPSVLGNKGLLDQKRAVAYPGFEPKVLSMQRVSLLCARQIYHSKGSRGLAWNLRWSLSPA